MQPIENKIIWKNPQDELPPKGRLVKIISNGIIYYARYSPDSSVESLILNCNWHVLDDNFPSGGFIDGWKETHEE